MFPAKIYLLLQEASKPQCTAIRINEIQMLLEEAVRKNSFPKDQDSFEYIVSTLFNEGLENLEKNPNALIDLFPVFAMLCGNRNQSRVARIDWDILDLTKK